MKKRRGGTMGGKGRKGREGKERGRKGSRPSKLASIRQPQSGISSKNPLPEQSTSLPFKYQIFTV